MDSISDLYECVESSIGESILTRQTQLNYCSQTYDVPDLVHLIKAHSTGGKNSNSNRKYHGYYHHSCGINFSLGLSSIAAYFGSLLSCQEKKRSIIDRSSYKIVSGTYCSYDPLTQYDLRAEFSLPGKFDYYWLSLSGHKVNFSSKIEEKKAWERLFIASFIRSYCSTPLFKQFKTLVVLDDLGLYKIKNSFENEKKTLGVFFNILKSIFVSKSTSNFKVKEPNIPLNANKEQEQEQEQEQENKIEKEEKKKDSKKETKKFKQEEEIKIENKIKIKLSAPLGSTKLPSASRNILTKAIFNYFFDDCRFLQCARFFWRLLPFSAEFAIPIAKSLIKANRYKQALIICEVALQIKPGSLSLKKMRIKALIKCNSIELALKEANSFTQLFPFHPSSYYLLAKVLIKDKNYNRALVILNHLPCRAKEELQTLLSPSHTNYKETQRKQNNNNNSNHNRNNHKKNFKNSNGNTKRKNKYSHSSNSRRKNRSKYNNPKSKIINQLSLLCPNPLRITSPLKSELESGWKHNLERIRRSAQNSSVLAHLPGGLLQDKINSKAYSILCKLYKILGWKSLLQIRSEVFEFMEIDCKERKKKHLYSSFGDSIKKEDNGTWMVENQFYKGNENEIEINYKKNPIDNNKKNMQNKKEQGKIKKNEKEGENNGGDFDIMFEKRGKPLKNIIKQGKYFDFELDEQFSNTENFDLMETNSKMGSGESYEADFEESLSDSESGYEIPNSVSEIYNFNNKQKSIYQLEWNLNSTWLMESDSEFENFQKEESKEEVKMESKIENDLKEKELISKLIKFKKKRHTKNGMQIQDNNNENKILISKKNIVTEIKSTRTRKKKKLLKKIINKNPIKNAAPSAKIFLIYQFNYEKWFDYLFNVLYNEVKIYTEIKYEQEHTQLIENNPEYRTPVDWERVGDLCLRLYQTKDAKANYYCSLKISKRLDPLTFSICLKLLKLYSKEGSISKVFHLCSLLTKSSADIKKTNYEEFVINKTIRTSIFQLVRKRGLKSIQKFVNNLKYEIKNPILEFVNLAKHLKVFGYNK
ncbi:bud site selection protein 7-related [Anaeramoeba flamelloides]|uniref:Bud site selection protein 7-related n=1 Tax=Anaeramoeba flamelloides TaxID=1746091 RepID=A0AAV7Z806_9EUKA|nr:bud site selection protein 7-related [Anaeramoeba flamelloides]